VFAWGLDSFVPCPCIETCAIPVVFIGSGFLTCEMLVDWVGLVVTPRPCTIGCLGRGPEAWPTPGPRCFPVGPVGFPASLEGGPVFELGIGVKLRVVFGLGREVVDLLGLEVEDCF
jgi:hypothetical protein